MWWVMLLASFGGTLALLVIVFAVIKRSIAKAAEALASEGVELDSGPVTVTARYRNFRAPGIYYGGIRRNPARIVLTKQRLHILQRPQRYGIIERGELSRFTVTADRGRLRIESSDPPDASGSVSFTARISDIDRWIAALTAAGARAA